MISRISQLGETANKLKAINFSIVGLNTNNIEAYRNAISGISKEQASLLLSTQGLNQAQIGLILSNEQVTASELTEASTLGNVIKTKNMLSAEQQKQLLASNALTSGKLAEVAATIGLETTEDGSLVSKRALNAEMVKQQLESIGIVGITQTQIMSMLGLTTAETTAATGASILSGAMAKLNIAIAANPIGALITAIGIGIASIYGISKAFDALTDSAEEIDERANDLISKYNELKNTAYKNASTIESLTSEYETLSKGVNDLGENISLTSDEYNRYNEIVNQIADMFPTLITGYTNEGTAILSLKGNIEELRDVYKEAQQEAYNLLISTGKDSDGNDIIESYKNLSELDWWDSNHAIIDAEDVTTTVKRDITKQILDLMNNMDTAVEEYDKLAKEIFDTYGDTGYNFLEEMGLPAIKNTFSNKSGITEDALKAGRATVQSYYQGFQAEIDNGVSEIRLVADAFLNTNDFYLDESTSSEIKNALSIMVNSIDEEISNSFDDLQSIGSYVNSITNSIKDNTEAQEALVNLFTMDLSDMPISKIVSDVNKYIDTISSAINEDPIKLKNRLGFDDLESEYQYAVNYAKEKFDGYDPTAFFDAYSINTKKEIDKWLEIARTADSAADTEKRYVQSLTANNEFFSFLSGTDIGERLEYITSQFNAGKISYSDYFSSLQQEIENVDFSNYTDSLEEASELSKQFFTDSIQQVSSGLSDLIDKFNNGEVSVSEYLDGYTSIAETLSVLTDSLQENSSAWNENGESIAADISENLDNTQSSLSDSIEKITELKNSVYSMSQIMSGELDMNSDEFTEHTQVVADELARIVSEGGEMAETIKSNLGTTSDEIASNMNKTVSNQSIAAQAIAANTNLAIDDMASAVGELFDTLGEQISNFKVNLSFGVKSISWDTANVLGHNLPLPKIDFSLSASGDSLSAIGDAVSNFGKSLKNNINSQQINWEDFANKPSDSYEPDENKAKDSNNESDNLKDSAKSAKSAAEDMEQTLTDALSRIQNAINELGKEASDTYDTWASRNDALNKQMAEIPNAIAAQQQLLDFYNSQGDTTKAEEAAYAIKEFQRQLKELANQKLENIQKFNEDIISLTESLKELANSYIDLKEARGITKNEADYQTLLTHSEEERKQYETELTELQTQLQENIDNGYLEEGSETWYEWQTELNGIKKSINECVQEQVEWAKEIKEMPLNYLEKFSVLIEKAASRIEAVNDKLSARGLSQSAANIREQLMVIDEQLLVANSEIEENSKLIRDYLSNDVNGWANLTEEQINKVFGFLNTDDSLGLHNYMNSIGLDDTTLEEFYKYVEEISDAQGTVSDLETQQIELNKSIQDLDITGAEKYGVLIEKLNSKISDHNSMLDARGLSKSVDDIKQEIHGLASTVMIEQNLLNNYNKKLRENLTDDANGWANLTEDQLDEVFSYIETNNHQGIFDFFNGIGIDPATLDGFWDLIGDIQTADSNIASATASQIELNKSMQQMDVTIYENLNTLLEKATTEIEGLKSLLESHGKTASDDLLSKQIRNSMKAIELYKSKIADYKEYIRLQFSDSVNGWADLTTQQIEKIFDYMNQNDVDGLNSYFESLGLSSGVLTEFWEVVKNISTEENNVFTEMVNQEGYFDDMLENRITLLEKIQEELQEINDAKNKALELEKARYALIEAQNNRNVMTWDGEQMVWTQDNDTFADALENLNNLEFDALIDSIDEATDTIQDLMDETNLYDDNGNLLSNWQDIIATAQTSVTDIISGIVSNLNTQGYDIDVPIFGNGGRIRGKSGDNNLLFAADKERVLTPVQNESFEKMVAFSTEYIPYLSQFPQINNLDILKTKPDYSVKNIESAPQNYYYFSGDINAPNVHDGNGLDALIKDLESLPLKAQQRINRINRL